jgi:nitric oxide reductase subunit B
MLGLGLTLFCMRGLTNPARWNNRLLATSYWCLNVGLAMMVFLSLLPQGLYQTYQSFVHGYAYARSPDVIHSPVMEALVWARVPGDLVFGIGALAFAAFVASAFMGSIAPKKKPAIQPAAAE